MARSKALAMVAPLAGLIGVIALFAILTAAPDRYLSAANLRVVLAQTVIVALSAIGMTMIIISAGIDLSVGAVIALASVVTALALRSGWSPSLAVLAGTLTGSAIGLINGLAITILRVVPFIATLGMLGIARGLAKYVADQQTVNAPPTWINELAVTFPSRPWMLFAPGVWLTIALAVAMTLVLRNTVFGRRIFAIGSNAAAARASGVHVEAVQVWI